MSDNTEQPIPYKTFSICGLVFLLGLVASGMHCDYQNETTQRLCLKQGGDPIHCAPRHSR